MLPIEQDSVYIYESNLSFKNNSFGGLLICKTLENDTLRVSLTSKFGMKVFDLLMFNRTIKTLYTVDPLDRKIIRKLFYKDFSLLYPYLMDSKKIIDKEHKVILKKPGKKQVYLLENKKITLIKRRSKLNSVILGYKDENISDLEIFHKIIGLKIKMKPLILPHE